MKQFFVLVVGMGLFLFGQVAWAFEQDETVARPIYSSHHAQVRVIAITPEGDKPIEIAVLFRGDKVPVIIKGIIDYRAGTGDWVFPGQIIGDCGEQPCSVWALGIEHPDFGNWLLGHPIRSMVKEANIPTP